MKVYHIKIIIKKDGERMVQDMTDKELITVTIDNYMNLQRIKQANGDTVNKELDYQLRGLVAKLSSFGVNIEDLTL